MTTFWGARPRRAHASKPTTTARATTPPPLPPDGRAAPAPSATVRLTPQQLGICRPLVRPLDVTALTYEADCNMDRHACQLALTQYERLNRLHPREPLPLIKLVIANLRCGDATSAAKVAAVLETLLPAQEKRLEAWLTLYTDRPQRSSASLLHLSLAALLNLAKAAELDDAARLRLLDSPTGVHVTCRVCSAADRDARHVWLHYMQPCLSQRAHHVDAALQSALAARNNAGVADVLELGLPLPPKLRDSAVELALAAQSPASLLQTLLQTGAVKATETYPAAWQASDSPLVALLQQPDPHLISWDNQLNKMRLLLAHGANPHTYAPGRTVAPVRLAMRSGPQWLQALLDHALSPCAADPHTGKSPLEYACEDGRLACMAPLLCHDRRRRESVVARHQARAWVAQHAAARRPYAAFLDAADCAGDYLGEALNASHAAFINALQPHDAAAHKQITAFLTPVVHLVRQVSALAPDQDAQLLANLVPLSMQYSVEQALRGALMCHHMRRAANVAASIQLAVDAPAAVCRAAGDLLRSDAYRALSDSGRLRLHGAIVHHAPRLGIAATQDSLRLPLTAPCTFIGDSIVDVVRAFAWLLPDAPAVGRLQRYFRSEVHEFFSEHEAARLLERIGYGPAYGAAMGSGSLPTPGRAPDVEEGRDATAFASPAGVVTAAKTLMERATPITAAQARTHATMWIGLVGWEQADAIVRGACVQRATHQPVTTPAAFKKLLLQCHPDKLGANKSAAEQTAAADQARLLNALVTALREADYATRVAAAVAENAPC